jgi:thioredoxin 1|tara:strand:+ start:35 stop:280 length:246 start_codon:yes stop_codon:yes gene_type:complete
MKNAKYFSASWCGPCKMFKPVVNELIQEGHPIEIIDVDENQELAQQYQIQSVPTIIIEEGDQVLEGIVGATSKEDLIQRLS